MTSKSKIDELISKTAKTNITITLPTHKKGEEVQQDPIRYKNLLNEAEKMLRNQELKESEVDALLKEPRKLIQDLSFWNYAEEGLAVYVNEDIFELFPLPYGLKEQAYLQDHFLITPLLPMISLDGTYNILSLSQKDLRLLRCTRKTVKDITPGDIFTNIEEFIEESPQEHLQFHTGAAKDEAVFFGHGGNAEDRKVVVQKYFRGVEESVTAKLKKYNEPLILGGTEEIVSLYRSINNYKRTVEERIKRYPGEMKDKELQQAGWNVVQNYFLKEMYHSLEEFKGQASERTSNNLSQIVESTVMGKTDTLFIAKDEQSWGFYDEENHTVQYAGHSNGDHQNELLNWTALKTFEKGGNVYVLPKEEMPHQSTVAALFRF